jgi:FkbM family methyltransferase
MQFLNRIKKYLIRNLRRDVLFFKFYTRYYPFQHRRNIQKYIRLYGDKFKVVDFLSFVWQFKEIFIDRIYEIPQSTEKEVIIDCGANVGLATYFFAKTYPKAEIFSYEADPQIFEVLKENIQSKFPDRKISLINKAIWKDDNSTIAFHSAGSDAGKIVMEDSNSVTTKVPTISLEKILTDLNSVDLLKIDIEGAEREVFSSITPQLTKIKFLFLEYHCWENEKPFLSEILNILEKNNFDYTLESIGNKNNIFLCRNKSQQKLFF